MAANRLEWHGADEDEAGAGRRVLSSATCPTGLYEIMECPGTALPGAVCESWFTRRSDGMLIFLGTARSIAEARASCEWDDGRGISATVKARGPA